MPGKLISVPWSFLLHRFIFRPHSLLFFDKNLVSIVTERIAQHSLLFSSSRFFSSSLFSHVRCVVCWTGLTGLDLAIPLLVAFTTALIATLQVIGPWRMHARRFWSVVAFSCIEQRVQQKRQDEFAENIIAESSTEEIQSVAVANTATY